MNHARYMRHCLQLASKGRGHTGINPLVGAVLVRDEKIIAEGWYMGSGTDHAERNLFKNFDQTIQPTDRLYVNLEPCNHTGETPPCTAAIIERGVQHVIVGMRDPDTRVSGQGIAALRAAGITVTGPVCLAECERLNRGFVSVRTKGRPYITLKKAQTKTGQVANTDGTKLCITSKEQNTWSHEHLRTTHDAILVGVGTVLVDNPQLTIRLNTKIDQSFPQPKKIILDPHLKTPSNAAVVDAHAIIVTHSTEQLGDATMLHVPGEKDFDLEKLMSVFVEQGISSILVEGGPITWDAFWQAGLVDETVTLVSC